MAFLVRDGARRLRPLPGQTAESIVVLVRCDAIDDAGRVLDGARRFAAATRRRVT